MKFRILLLLAPLSLGCSDPAADKPAASVDNEAPPPEQAPAPAVTEQAGAPLSFTGAGSSIHMVGSKITGTHEVEIKDFKGEIALAKDAPLESGRVNVVMQMGSIEADHPKLTKHLLADDFFAAAAHPTCRFESTAIAKGGADGASHSVTGQLTLRGVRKSIQFPATIEREGAAVKVKAEFSINRKDFGIVYPGKPDDLIRDDVLIKLELRAQ